VEEACAGGIGGELDVGMGVGGDDAGGVVDWTMSMDWTELPDSSWTGGLRLG
jgi:hypothetical protein